LQAEMLLYIRPYTNPCLLSCGDCTSSGAVSQTIKHSQYVNTATYVQLTSIDITLGYPAVNVTSTKDTLTHYLQRPEVHHNCPSFFWLAHFC